MMDLRPPAAPRAAARAATPALSTRQRSRATIARTLYWNPPVAEWVPLKRTRNSSLRIAALVEDRLADGLAFEGELMLLTPDNGERVLRYAKPDLLLVESVQVSSTGHWHLAQHPASPEYADVVALVELARRLSIPSVFWITKGSEYHEHFRACAGLFDLVCCADPREVERLAAEGIQAQVLLPCVQPAQFAPFRRLEDYAALDIEVLFDGWADLDRLADRLDVLQRLKPFGLKIVESRYELFETRLAMVPGYQDDILGCLTPAARRTVLKYARCYASVEETLSTRTSQQWLAVEAAASRCLVVHQGTFAPGDLRGDFAVACDTPDEFVAEFIRCREDDLYRERLAHLGWRAVNEHHTFAHRIRTICRHLGVAHDWVEHPKASLVTPTYRKDLLPRCVQTFEQIDYPDKELVLVYNGDTLPSFADAGLPAPRPDVVITHVPSELFAGAALNMGHLQASGTYCFRLDDDDLYAPNYVRDMILQARSVDAALFGKPSAPLVFEGDEKVYVKGSTTPLAIASLKQLRAGQTWIGGNSISGLRSFFDAHRYSAQSYGAADTDLILNLPPATDAVIALMDPFNMAAERRSDLSSHTWKNSEDKLKANRVSLASFGELVI